MGRRSCSTARTRPTGCGINCRARFSSRLSTSGCDSIVVDGHDVARQTGMGGRINTPMQSCFFALAGLMPREEAIEHMKAAIRKSYGKRGETIVEQNFAAIDMALERLQEVEVPAEATGRKQLRPPVARQ